MQHRTCTERYIVRMPDGMRDRIKAMAGENERSMNAEIVFHLRKAIAAAGQNEQDRQGGHPDGLMQS
ncbi:Arc family DNA-binding protein [Paracoccus methylovorus]|uniref:Arc family DNA-binding protein n=1 Tax=Paracoccus methylovorus TaxID=2812658 RepID=A0ABX7JMA9_9RHOB|nr:Arc family DNA-binding protein [Paracoccus methylovorus]